jgi:nicotinamide mononucleotide transporter
MDVLVNIFGYPLTYIEFFGVLAYFVSIYFATKVNVLTWSTGIISSILFCILYFNTHTYANAVLQIILIGVSVNGWLKWGRDDSKKISNLKRKDIINLCSLSIISTIVLGYFMDLYLYDPYPYLDMSIFVLSIVGTVLLVNKKIESWYFWILVNVIALFIYSSLGYYFISFQCVAFIIIDIIALKEWNKNLIK